MSKRNWFILTGLILMSILIILVIRNVPGNKSPTPELLTLDEITKRTNATVYHVDPTSRFEQLITQYSYSDDGDQLHIGTYFIVTGTGAAVTLWTTTVPTSDPPTTKGTVTIKWATGQTGYICDPPSEASNVTPTVTFTYATCLYWIDQIGGVRQILYSAWDQKDTLEFVSPLLRVNSVRWD